MVYRVVCRYFGFTADWENWGENDRMSKGWGAGKGKGIFLSPPPPPSQFFFLSPTLGKFFTSPQLSTISRWRPEQPMEIYIHSPHQNPPALQAIGNPINYQLKLCIKIVLLSSDDLTVVKQKKIISYST